MDTHFGNEWPMKEHAVDSLFLLFDLGVINLVCIQLSGLLYPPVVKFMSMA